MLVEHRKSTDLSTIKRLLISVLVGVVLLTFNAKLISASGQFFRYLNWDESLHFSFPPHGSLASWA